MSMKSKKGTLFVFSGPSGAGKGTIVSELLRRMDGLAYSVSCTTRAPREGERDGVDYHFISDDEFTEHVEAGDFLEWADVHGHRYGTLKADVLEALEDGRNVVLEIDVQGALQVKKAMPDAVTIFIAPPSLEELARRLRERGSEDERERSLRLANARRELLEMPRYELAVVNDDLASTVNAVEKFMRLHRSSEPKRSEK